MPDLNRELSDFLRRARGAVDPLRAGLPADGRVRRVPGLRREEVALLAGVSTDYYVRLEQGRRISPSRQVVNAIAAALELDAAGRTHLDDLIEAASVTAISRPAQRRLPGVQRVRPGLHQLLDSFEGQPAFILGRRTEILASNRLARALLADFDSLLPRERNYARWVLLSDEARSLFVDWEVQARSAVESLRLDAGTAPDDHAIHELVGELTEHSPEFARWWREHRVYQRTFGSKRLRHPIVGELTIDYETLTLPGDPGQTLFIYSTEANSLSRQAMNLLASWTAPGSTASASHLTPDGRSVEA
jgi:transcriptional regulator with XRE-family HTH domain